MRKAVLVIDDPGCCGNCSLMESYLDEQHETWIEKCVPVYRNIPDYDEKPDWCPLKVLPPIQPERMLGKWINGICNQCGGHAPYWAMASTYCCSNYCPNCGADMER